MTTSDGQSSERIRLLIMMRSRVCAEAFTLGRRHAAGMRSAPLPLFSVADRCVGARGAVRIPAWAASLHSTCVREVRPEETKLQEPKGLSEDMAKATTGQAPADPAKRAVAEPLKPSAEVKKSLPIKERIRNMWNTVKYLFRFYLNGVKQIWRNRERVQLVREDLRKTGRDMTYEEGILMYVDQHLP